MAAIMAMYMIHKTRAVDSIFFPRLVMYLPLAARLKKIQPMVKKIRETSRPNTGMVNVISEKMNEFLECFA
jgi:hypothetical protein